MLKIDENAHQSPGGYKVMTLDIYISIDDDFFERLGALRNSHFSSANLPTVSITT
jgi:hypothetical protein